MDAQTLFGSGFNNLTAFILAAVRANAVRQFWFVAVGALSESGLAERVMGAAILRARIGVSSFGIRHCSGFLLLC
jgi:hypothetical protein